MCVAGFLFFGILAPQWGHWFGVASLFLSTFLGVCLAPPFAPFGFPRGFGFSPSVVKSPGPRRCVVSSVFGSFFSAGFSPAGVGEV